MHFVNYTFYTSLQSIYITAAQNEVALGYHRLRGLHFLAAVFSAIIIVIRSTYWGYCINS